MEGISKGEIAHALAGSATFTDNFSRLETVELIRTAHCNPLGREAARGAPEAYVQLLNEGISRADLATAI